MMNLVRERISSNSLPACMPTYWLQVGFPKSRTFQSPLINVCGSGNQTFFKGFGRGFFLFFLASPVLAAGFHLLLNLELFDR